MEAKAIIEAWIKELSISTFAIRLIEDELDSMGERGKKSEPIFIELHHRLAILKKRQDDSIVKAENVGKALEQRATAIAQRIAHEISPTCTAIAIKSYVPKPKFDKKYDITEIIVNELDVEFLTHQK